MMKLPALHTPQGGAEDPEARGVLAASQGVNTNGGGEGLLSVLRLRRVGEPCLTGDSGRPGCPLNFPSNSLRPQSPQTPFLQI